MKTTLNLNEALINEALKLSKSSNKTQIINNALKSYIRGMKRETLIEMFGKGIIDDSFCINEYRDLSNDR